MNVFVNWWETGIALVLFNISLFVMVIVSFGVGFRKSVARSKEKKGATTIKIYKTGFSTISFFSFLLTWLFLTLWMSVRGWM